MKEFIENLIEKLEEEHERCINRYGAVGGNLSAMEVKQCMEIVNQLAEEYKYCIKSSCSNCEVYDKEKHYCPKWCEVIKHTTSELAEEHNNDFCEWKIDGVYLHCQHDTELVISCLEDEKYRYNYCPVCGKRIKVVKPKGE